MLVVLGARHPELSVRGLRVKSGERKLRAPSQAVWMRRAGAERAMDARIEPPSHAPLRRSGSGAVWMVMRFACWPRDDMSCGRRGRGRGGLHVAWLAIEGVFFA